MLHCKLYVNLMMENASGESPLPSEAENRKTENSISMQTFETEAEEEGKNPTSMTLGILDIDPETLYERPVFTEPETIAAINELGYAVDDLVIAKPESIADLPEQEGMRVQILLELDRRRKKMIEDVIRERNRMLSGKDEPVPASSTKSVNRKSKRKKKHARGPTKTTKEPKTEEELKKMKEATHRLNRPAGITNADAKPLVLKRRKKAKKLTAEQIRMKRIMDKEASDQKKLQKQAAKNEKIFEKRIAEVEQKRMQKAEEARKKRITRLASQQKALEKIEKTQQKAANDVMKKLQDAEKRRAMAQRERVAELKRRAKAREERSKLAEQEALKIESMKRSKFQKTLKLKDQACERVLQAKQKQKIEEMQRKKKRELAFAKAICRPEVRK